jgi:hypothetical protein
VIRVDETAMLPLLGYLQLLQQHERAGTRSGSAKRWRPCRQRRATQLRMAMLLGQVRGTPELCRARKACSPAVLKATSRTAASLHPLARLLATHYGERQKLEATRPA